MTAPPPERGRRRGGRQPGWRDADQPDPYSEPEYDDARRPAADYPADDWNGSAQAGLGHRGQDPGADQAPPRPTGRHSRRPRPDADWSSGQDSPDASVRGGRRDRAGTPDGRSGARPGPARYSDPRYSDAARPADPGRGPDPRYPDLAGPAADPGRRPGPRIPDPAGYAGPARQSDPRYSEPARPPADPARRSGPRHDDQPLPGRPAGYTDPAGRGQPGGDQFLSDSWYRESRPAGRDRPGGGPAGSRPGTRPGSREQQPGPQPFDEIAQYEAAQAQRNAQRGPRTWADYQDKPYGGAAYGYVGDADRRSAPGDGESGGPAASDPGAGEAGLAGGAGYGFTAALGNYRDRREPVIYEDPRLADGSLGRPDQGIRYERTRQLDLPDVLPTAGGGSDPTDTGQFAAISQSSSSSSSSSVLRSSGVMAVGTLGSRLTGFLRTIAQSSALGIAGIAGAYNVSNTLPNVVYNLALGGILTSVIVPLIVNAKKRAPDAGEAYEQRMFTMVTAALLAVTVIATVATVPIVHAYSDGSVSGPTEHLAVLFAFFFIPQIFFYGVSSLIGAVLNTRGSFAAPMWTPILNNVVVIAVLGLYVALAGLNKTPTTITPFEIKLLGLGTTLGVVVQTVALVPALRKVGFRWRPRIDFRQGEIAEIGRMAGWMFCYIGATQVAFLITIKVAEIVPNSAGVTEYNYAWLLFQLPYAVVGISVITALLPRMSAHASAGQLSLVRTDFSAGIRLAATIVVPCSLVLAVLGPAVTRVFLAHGATHAAEAHTLGIVFAVFCLGLLPYMIFQLQLRVFYSLHDSKTPALIGLATMTVNIVTNLVALALLRHSANLVAGLGVGFGLANLLGSLLAWRILSIRMRGLDGHAVGQSLARMHVATVPAVLVALLIDHFFGTGSFFAAAGTLVIGGGGALVTYVLAARLLHIRELATVSATIKSRLGR